MSGVAENSVTLSWNRFDNFFALYDELKTVRTLIYVIGEAHHCYIGCVGCKNGIGGLGVRYQKQYLDRARAIFGLDASKGQPSYAGLIETPRNPSPELVERIERNIQNSFLLKHGKNNCLFEIQGTVETISILHRGSRPPFL